MRARVLFVEDDDTLRPVLQRELEGFGHSVESCTDAGSALELLRSRKFDAALLDLRLPDMDGLELLGHVRSLDADLPVVFLTGHGGLSDAVAAMRAGAFDFLGKPTPLDELELVLARAIGHGALVRKNLLLRSLVEREVATEIVGESPAIEGLRSSIARIGPGEANVLVVGESGTGKELVARALHASSDRAAAAFVPVNCAAIPTELFESELFGHCRGAFTGADKKRLGLIEIAEGGTLFLDEVGELPPAVQPALLRAVQFGEFRPVGAERNEVADVRIVAATNRDLTESVVGGEFREDLYHRIATLVITVPPLRERGDDVALLAERLLERHNAKLPVEQAKHFTASALDRLRAQEWRGNVREVENVVLRLVTLVDTPSIEGADVDAQVRPLRLDAQGAQAAQGALPSLDLETLERTAILQALQRHGGNRKRVSAELGVAVKTLYNKIRQHRIAQLEWEGDGPSS